MQLGTLELLHTLSGMDWVLETHNYKSTLFYFLYGVSMVKTKLMKTQEMLGVFFGMILFFVWLLVLINTEYIFFQEKTLSVVLK